ncbi:MAG: hypothetical protein QM762_00195 [Chryseolinea sp.]
MPSNQPSAARRHSFTPCAFVEGHRIGRITAILLAFILWACGGGTLSDDQRKKMKEGIQDQKITQVSDAEIVAAAMDEGRHIFEALEKSKFDATQSQRIAREQKVKVRYITPGAGNALEVENQIIQAYVVGSVTGATQDNIQKLRSGAATSLQDYDTLMYSHPIVTSQPDGSINVNGVWNVYLAKREIVRSLSKK